ncbi:tetratricopeptide repeat protein [Niabella yanshanensis]|uniref:Tetratricopeptide repeat protein n=1 Tax=Niabella yanshanensis TaxID=577386 RepID=A0ABZ0W3R1_9BACT|nr:tetratricopeptide repeat protein [Niabella yanshanensis]WQD36716.1 tetratricopeptide repeat protein [Niabella yanshanensis]
MTNFEKIEAYTEGWMSEPERAAFELELQTDAQLKRDYDDWLEADDILKRHIGNESNIAGLKQILNPLTQQHFKTGNAPKSKVVSIKKYVMAAIAAAAIFILYLSLPGGLDNYTVPNMPQAVVRGSEELSNKGALLFNEGKYEEALPLLKAQASSDPQDATTHFFYAVSLVKVKKFEDALVVLKPLSKGESAYKEDAAFFAALSAYQLNRKSDALAFAEKVTERSVYYRPSQKIIKKCR